MVDLHVFLLASPHTGGLAGAVDYALAAERLGYSGVWTAEHHFIRYGVCPSAVAFAAHVLGRTERLTVGTAAAVLSTRHPVALGEEAAMLDELSGGRFALGVARGGPWVDLEVFQTGPERYAHGFAESLDLLLEWTSGARTVGADGPTFRFREVAVVPRPRRRLPVWVAATGTGTVDLAAERGLPLLLGMHATDEEKAALLARYAATAARHGHDPVAVGHAGALLAHVAADDETARAEVRRHLPRLLSGTRDYVRLDGTTSTKDLTAYTESLIGIGAVGSPETCRRRLEQAARVGVRHLLLMVEAAGDREDVLRNLARLSTGESLHFADDLMPS
ncbi:alkanal monooxygenase [Virgisporangium aliadipatigenens]|uniref:Alkanal monooxygenase n=1 Tax=Virgisporangium aliadipatigenens TaxID=741659 RepID=A0A8J3YS61_9ACTN|nr:LLM class flavin-dependent oxidoreductase [Virgisporangium aliadipatigenens]GIJ48758.1 alkanal monooxygenase [Virgisporangium aliadipatigenens]